MCGAGLSLKAAKDPYVDPLAEKTGEWPGRLVGILTFPGTNDASCHLAPRPESYDTKIS